MTTLKERIGRLENVEAIRRLKARYAYLADAKYTEDHRRKPEAELDAVAWQQALRFTEDAMWDGGPTFGRAEGRRAIYDLLRAGPWTFAMHYFMNPLITVDGDRASGRWMLWEAATLAQGETAVLISALTDDDYVRVDGNWLMSRMRLTLRFMVPFPGGDWSRLRNAPFRP